MRERTERYCESLTSKCLKACSPTQLLRQQSECLRPQRRNICLRLASQLPPLRTAFLDIFCGVQRCQFALAHFGYRPRERIRRDKASFAAIEALAINTDLALLAKQLSSLLDLRNAVHHGRFAHIHRASTATRLLRLNLRRKPSVIDDRDVGRAHDLLKRVN